MKAVLCPKYGSTDVLQFAEIATPTPKDNEIRIKIHAAVVGPSDCSFRKGEPFIVKLIYGLRKPKFPILGTEFAGEVDSIGKDVTLFKKGDHVFAISPDTFGGHAEYKCLPEDKPIAVKSPNMTYEEAASICDGALTALTFLRDTAHIKSGQKVLINGASGAVGVYAVQLAKYYGAEVTGVCSSANVGLVKSLGTDHVIDYTQTDFTKTGQTYDIIFDAVGKSSFSRCKNMPTPHGVYLTTVPSLAIIRQILLTSVGRGKKAKFAMAALVQNKSNLTFMNELFDAGYMKAVIDRRFPLKQVAEAHRYVETGRKKGNVVVTVVG